MTWSIFVGNGWLGAYPVAQSPDILGCRCWKTRTVMTNCEAGISLKSCAPLLQSGHQPQPEFHVADGGGIPGWESWQLLTYDKSNHVFKPDMNLMKFEGRFLPDQLHLNNF